MALPVSLYLPQVVVHDGRILEKPESDAEARAFISGYSLSSAQTVGSVLVTNLNSGKEAMAVDVAQVSGLPESQVVVAFWCGLEMVRGGERIPDFMRRYY